MRAPELNPLSTEISETLKRILVYKLVNQARSQLKKIQIILLILSNIGKDENGRKTEDTGN
jgi:hypothetical protein